MKIEFFWKSKSCYTFLSIDSVSKIYKLHEDSYINSNLYPDAIKVAKRSDIDKIIQYLLSEGYITLTELHEKHDRLIERCDNILKGNTATKE